ncbi:anaerobic ribonucleoside-triphosphate reductase [Alkalihalobacterium bogoriense]|uniref:anaerobic ribonucleoside-triphosphate reductase n=1 Tax=Alkalihalobacterium bogoriense TaxID=246272 RepID=UPI002480830D|nr:anaerobic ribonucleoside-triphosphate reductase [Alkalihalobacterium bogoriense]
MKLFIAFIVSEQNHMGYGSINYPAVRCHSCGYTGVIHDKCPKCGTENEEKIGYMPIH